MIEWTTAKGTNVRIAIETEEPNLADHNFTNACYKLVVRGNGRDVFLGSGFDVVDHEQAGPALKPWFGNTIVPIDPGKVEAVKALIETYSAEIKRRSDTTFRADAEYQAHYDAVEKLRTTGKI